MNTHFPIRGILQQTMVPLAHVSTAGRVRAPDAHARITFYTGRYVEDDGGTE